MYSIAIYDSIPNRGEKLSQLCKSIMKKQGIPCDIQTYTNPKLIIQEIHPFNLVIIDITRQPAIGLWIGKELRLHCYYKHLIFISDCDVYHQQAFDLHAFQYLYIPLHQDSLVKTLLESYHMQNHGPYLVLRIHEDYQRIPLVNIMYIESERIYVFIHLTNEIIRYREKLSTILKYLESYPFIRCHQSYIINLLQVKKIEPNMAYTIDNQQIPISKAYSQIVRKAFLSFSNLDNTPD